MKYFRTPTSIFLALITIFIIYPQFSHSAVILPTVFGNFIEEFYTSYTTDVNKPFQVAQWVINNPITISQTTLCNFYFLLGGLGKLNPTGYYQRSYSNLPNHNIFYYLVYMIVINDWTASDSVTVQFDTSTPHAISPYNYKLLYGRDLCENNQYDVHLMAFGRVIHSSNSLTLKVISNVNGVTAAFGVHKVKILLHNDTTGLTAQQIEVYYGGVGFEGSPNVCLTKFYPDPVIIGNCLACDVSCYHCFAASNTGCYACASGYFWDGDRCVTGGCPTGCQICSPNDGRCSLCLPTYILSWDYTCRLGCDSPLILETTGDFRFCKTPCQDAGTFMLWNGTCVNSCNFPLQTRIEGNAKFCDYPCSMSQYLFIDGTCSATCDYVIRIEGNYKFCDPCQPTTSFAYWNNKCFPTCDFPNRQNIAGQYRACLRPCQASTDYFYLTDGLCRSSCAYPYKVQDTVYCVLDVASNTASDLDFMRQALTGGGYFMSSASIAASIGNYGNPGAMFLFAIIDLLEYIRYMDIVYPPKLQYILDRQDSYGDYFPFVPGIPDKLSNEFPRYTLPGKFEYYHLHSSFFVNSWELMISILTGLFITIMVTLISFCTLPGTTMYKMFEKIKLAFRWNFFLVLFVPFYGNVIINTSLETRTIHLDYFSSILSLGTCVVVIAFFVFVFIKVIFVVKSAWNLRPSKLSNQSPSESAEEKLKNYKVVFDSYKPDFPSQIIFMPLFIIRISLFSAVIGFLFDYPIAQALALTVISGAIVIYLIAVNPFKQVYELLEILAQEVLLLIVNICVLVLAVLDEVEVEAFEDRAAIGDVIIVCSFVSAGTAIFYLVYHNFLLLKEIYEMIKKAWPRSTAKVSLSPPTEANTSKTFNLNDLSLGPNSRSTVNLLNPHIDPLKPEDKYKQEMTPANPLDETAEPVGNQSRMEAEVPWDNNNNIQRRNSRKSMRVSQISFTPSSMMDNFRFDGGGGAGGNNEPYSMTQIQIEEAEAGVIPQAAVTDKNWRPNQKKRLR